MPLSLQGQIRGQIQRIVQWEVDFTVGAFLGNHQAEILARLVEEFLFGCVDSANSEVIKWLHDVTCSIRGRLLVPVEVEVAILCCHGVYAGSVVLREQEDLEHIACLPVEQLRYEVVSENR